VRGLIAEEDLVGVPIPRRNSCLSGTRALQHHRTIAIGGHGHPGEVGTLAHATGGGAASKVLGTISDANRSGVTGSLGSTLHRRRWRNGTSSGGSNPGAETTSMQSGATSSQHIHQLPLTILSGIQWCDRGSIGPRGPISGGFITDRICKQMNGKIFT